MLFDNFKEETLYKYETKVFNFIDKYQSIFDKVIDYFDHVILAVIIAYEKVIFFMIYLMSLCGKFMRYSTFPLHWIWIKLDLRKSESKLTDLPIFKLGAHYIYGKPKAGKSTLLFAALLDYAHYTGKTAYTTAPLELPRKNVYGHEYYYHQLFTPNEFYEDGEQIVSFNTFKHNAVVYEEMLTQYQQRNNAKKSYKDEVLPMIAAMGTQRHQGIDLFYFVSQLPRNDIAIMQMLVGFHEPQIKKAFDYKHWLNTGKFRFYIKGWWIISSKIQITESNSFKLVNSHKWWYPNKFRNDFEYFNRLNMKKKYSNLPLHKGKEML